MPPHLELGIVHHAAETHEVRHRFELLGSDIRQRFGHARVLAQKRGRRPVVRSRQQRTRDRQKIIRVEQALFEHPVADLGGRSGNLRGHGVEHCLHGIEEVRFLDLLQHGVVGPMPGLQQRIGGDKHRQIVVPNIVKDIGKTVGAEAFAHDKAVLLEHCELPLIEPKIKGAVPGVVWYFAFVCQVWIRVESVPKLSRGRVPGDAGQVGRAVREHRGELVG